MYQPKAQLSVPNNEKTMENCAPVVRVHHVSHMQPFQLSTQWILFSML